MRRLFALFSLVLTGLAASSGGAAAHPHVFVVSQSEVLYDAQGEVTGIRHAWTFDDMFSSYATQGLESKEKGKFTREELAPLAEVNVTSLKEYDFFTFAKIDGKKAELKDPVDYWLEQKDSALVLHFTLPLKKPAKAARLDLEIYDPSYFVDFSLAEKDAIALSNAPAQCKAEISAANGNVAGVQQRLSEAFFDQPAAQNWGAQFAQRISVKCP